MSSLTKHRQSQPTHSAKNVLHSYSKTCIPIPWQHWILLFLTSLTMPKRQRSQKTKTTKHIHHVYNKHTFTQLS